MSALQGSEIPRNYQGNQAEGGGCEFAIKGNLFITINTLPGQRGMFMIWQNLSLRAGWLCSSCDMRASDIFLNPTYQRCYLNSRLLDWI